MTIIEKIKAEIERRIKELHEAEIDYREDQCDTIVSCLVSGISELQRVLTLLNTLEKSLPAKVADGEVLEEEINRTYHDGSVADTSNIDHVTYENIAEHFYDLGCRRTAEKYDESEKPTNMELKDEIDKSINSLDGCFTKINGVPEYHLVTDEELRKFASHFAEWGAERQKEQMMKEAVEAKFISMDEGIIKYSPLFTRKLKQIFRPSDKVRIIIVKEN